jgi:hypothetical protein
MTSFISEYDKSFKVPINRKSRSFQRMIKLKLFKFEVYYRRYVLQDVLELSMQYFLYFDRNKAI